MRSPQAELNLLFCLKSSFVVRVRRLCGHLCDLGIVGRVKSCILPHWALPPFTSPAYEHEHSDARRTFETTEKGYPARISMLWDVFKGEMKRKYPADCKERPPTWCHQFLEAERRQVLVSIARTRMFLHRLHTLTRANLCPRTMCFYKAYLLYSTGG
jgi:hypothetical protein